MNFLLGMYREHGASAVRVGNWICVDGGRLFTRAAHFDHLRHPQNLILQADFVTVTIQGQHIIESFAGIGPDFTSALQDACKSFQDCSFHALFVTLLGRPCEHVDREVWSIGGQNRQITLGWLRYRGDFPTDQWAPIFEGLQKHLESFSLTRGLHWVRYFYSHVPSQAPTIEVLIDNEISEPLQSLAANLPLATSGAVYSTRLFFTIQDATT
ncbi:MAG: hypothetical protein IPK32_20445 [Verrucomicrobiaceae bacterium]|nr:hypothetical protein [Verrucomicrobiaceae bacterium]